MLEVYEILKDGTSQLIPMDEGEDCKEKLRLEKLLTMNFSSLSDTDIGDLLKAGYTQVHDEYGKRKVREFLAKHQELPREVKGFPIIFTYEEDIIHLHLRIPPWGVSLRTLRGADRELERIRKAVRPYQLEGVALDIVAWKKEGKSNSKIARQLNERVAEELEQYRVYEYQASCPGEKSPEEISGLRGCMKVNKGYAQEVLQEMGFSKADAEKMVSNALKLISVGMEKWPIPISKSTAIDLEAQQIDGHDLYEEPPPGYDEWLTTTIDARDKNHEFIKMILPTKRVHRKGQPYRYPITAAHVRAKLKSLHLP